MQPTTHLLGSCKAPREGTPGVMKDVAELVSDAFTRLVRLRESDDSDNFSKRLSGLEDADRGVRSDGGQTS